MREAELRGMQRLAPEAAQHPGKRGGCAARNHEPAPVDRVAHERVSRVREVQADLVRAAGLERDAHPGVAAAAPDHPVTQERLAPTRADCPERPTARMAV